MLHTFFIGLHFILTALSQAAVAGMFMFVCISKVFQSFKSLTCSFSGVLILMQSQKLEFDWNQVSGKDIPCREGLCPTGAGFL